MKKEFDTISIFLRTFGIFGVILGVLFFSGTIFANSGGGFFKIGSPASVAAKGMVGYWPLDSASMKNASTTADLTSNANDGTLYGRALASRLTTDRKGVANGAMEFDGVGDYVSLLETGSLPTVADGSFSVSAWAKISDANSTRNILRRDNIGNGGSESRRVISLATLSGTGFANFGMYEGTSNSAVGAVNRADAKWHHYVGIYDAVGKNVYLYVDGVLEGSKLGITTNSFNTAREPWVIGNVSPIYDGEWMLGSISDVRIYNYALPQSEITQLYDDYKPKVVIDSLEKGLVGHWPLDSASMKSASTTADVTPYGNDGTLYGRPLASRLTTDRKQVANGAMSFDGSTDYVDTGAISRISGDAEASLSIWFKTNNNVDAPLVVFGEPGVALKSFALILGANRVVGAAFNGGNNYNSGSNAYSLGQWHNLVATKTPGAINTTTKLYLDGAEIPVGSASSNTPNINGTASYIGKWINAGLANYGGQISDVRIYNRALSQSEITRLYDNYKPKVVINSLNKGLVGYWPLDSKSMKSASTTADLTPQGNDGTLYGRPLASRLTTDRKGVENSAMAFNGTGDYVDTPTNQITNYPLTISVWFKVTGVDSQVTIISYNKRSESAKYIQLETRIIGVNKLLSAQVRNINGWSQSIYSSSVLSNDIWYNGVVTINSSNYLKLYLNGILVNDYGNVVNFENVINNFAIGRLRYTSESFFTGSISDVRIYNRALSADEVKMLYEKY